MSATFRFDNHFFGENEANITKIASLIDKNEVPSKLVAILDHFVDMRMRAAT